VARPRRNFAGFPPGSDAPDLGRCIRPRQSIRSILPVPTHLVLLCAGTTASFRAARFADPAEPLDAGGREAVRRFVAPARRFDRCMAAPGAAARETALLLSLAAEEEPALRDINAGDWAGRGLDDLDPDALAAWLATPEAGAPGGESMAAVAGRVGTWLDGLTAGSVLAITHVAAIRAAVAHALAVPVAATIAIDVTPLMAITLSRHGRWRLQEMRRA
jgi:broad specificity phosphatase PhoE